ncbi:MAG: sugar transferase [Candidatus Melainabacteria bacterium]|nr:sugar transferase [Candidatus Melainabacteria bacterium]
MQTLSPSVKRSVSRVALLEESEALLIDEKKPSFPADASVEVQFLRHRSRFAFRAGQFLKRAADVVLASAGLCVLSPLLAVLAVSVKATSPDGPILYHSPRVGRQGKTFHMYKFRTMRTDADALRDQLREEANLQGQLFKIKNDPRITPIGHILRAYSLDELPQLFNVLRGEMSLVGPRPLPPDESAWFQSPYTLRYQVTPGITGAWQVNGRSNADFKTLARLELDYVLGWSLLKDLQLLFKTFPAVLCRSGAY